MKKQTTAVVLGVDKAALKTKKSATKSSAKAKAKAVANKPATLRATTGKGNELSIFARPLQKGSKKATPRGKVAIIYTRVSTKEQAETNQSLSTQLERCTAYAERHGYQVVGKFGGTYESAKSDERKEFQKMLEFVKKSKLRVGYIIVYSHDRFSRTGSSAIGIVDELGRMGISVVAVTQPVDTQTAAGKLQQGIQFLFSQFDNDQRREKCMTGMEARVRRGLWVGKVPMGYDKVIVGKEVILKPNKTGKLIRLAFQLKAEQGLSNTDIIKRLKAQGLVLYNQTITKLFRNPFYCGLISHGLLEDGEVVEGQHEPLITRQLFLKVNGLQAQNAHSYTQVKEDEELPLRHHIKCGSCRKPLTGYEMKKKGIHYYKCNTIGCKLNRNANKLHNLYEGFLAELEVDPRYLPKLAEIMEETYYKLNGESRKEEKRLHTQHTELKKRLDTLERRYAFGEIEKDIFTKYSIELKTELLEIEQNLEKCVPALSNPKEFIKMGLEKAVTISQSWSKSNVQPRKQLQAMLFPEGVYYDREMEGYRTTRVNGFFALSSLVQQFLVKNEKGKSDVNHHFSLSVVRRGHKPNSCYETLRYTKMP
ncbi:recombinase family protein [Pontibacter vulgaris]|uniref:recombinase family protein n=1 Tax=Pontibacter vulgaris TaxID=2905679 RepID=UPI001FA6F417|nr:recombinase family protein [Pontibacter vulgaris]